MKSTNIISVDAQNYGPFDEISLNMSGKQIILLEGPNGSGKSKLGQILEHLANNPGEHVLKDGTESGSYKLVVTVDGETYTLIREFDNTGKDKSTLTDGNGVKVSPTKSNLQRIFSMPVLDPLGIASMKEKDIVNKLFKIADYSPESLDRQRDELYTKRGDVYRDRQGKLGVLRELPEWSEDDLRTYKEPQEHSAVLARFQGIVDLNNEYAKHEQELESYRVAKENSVSRLTDQEAKYEIKLAELAAQIAEVNAKMEAYRETTTAKHREYDAAMAERVLWLEKNTRQDASGVQGELGQVEEHNRKHREVLSYLKAQEEADELGRVHNELTQQINKIDEQKAQELSKLELPLGLSVMMEEELTEGGKTKTNGKVSYVPYYNGRRLVENTINTAEIYKVGVQLSMLEIASDVNDPSPILRLKADCLDDTSLNEVVELVKDQGFFAFIEKPKGVQKVDKLTITAL